MTPKQKKQHEEELKKVQKYRKASFGAMIIICGVLFFWQKWALVGMMILLSIITFHFRSKEALLNQ